MNGRRGRKRGREGVRRGRKCRDGAGPLMGTENAVSIIVGKGSE